LNKKEIVGNIEVLLEVVYSNLPHFITRISACGIPESVPK